MTESPSVVIVSSSNTKPKSLIKLITKRNDLNDSSNSISLKWKINTKYYTADIEIFGIDETYPRTESFNDRVEALIIHMDSNKPTGLTDLEVWDKLEQDSAPEIKLLLANYCTNETKITRNAATEWCLKHGFEFIELYPSQKPQSDIIEEKIGVERVIEALETHTWSNMVMKSQKCDEDLLENDDFSDLFAQLSMMKESLQSLPTSQRKQCAEQVVTAFWKAIGGDEEEIADV